MAAVVGRKCLCPIAIGPDLFRDPGSGKGITAGLPPTPERATGKNEQNSGDTRKNSKGRVGLIQ